MKLTPHDLSRIFPSKATETKAELSYLDLLNKLNKDVKSDLIPDDEKRKILRLIAQLEAMLWKYSA